MEKNYTEIMKCSKETKNLIMIDCKKEFIAHHPEFNGVLITQGFILKKITEYYLKDL